MSTPREERKVLLFSTWGDPEGWVPLSYILAAKSGASRPTYSSTAALMEILNPARVRIFIQDSLYLKEVVRQRKPCEPELERAKLAERVKALVLSSGAGKEVKHLKDRLTPVPGVASYKDGAYVYVWRGEGFYEVLVGALTEHVLEDLEEEAAPNLEVVIDTTHGVNYFAVALASASRLASSIYLLKHPVGASLTITHYNSDPLMKLGGEDPRGASIRINLVAEERHRGIAATYLASTVENLVALRGSLSKAAETLDSYWSGKGSGEWEKALAACLLFFRGAPHWALHFAHKASVPAPSELRESLGKIKVSCENKGTTRKYTYEWGERRPTAEVVVVSEIVAALKELGKSASAGECGEKVKELLLGLLERGAEDRWAKTIERALQLLESAPCYDLARLEKSVEGVYPRSLSSLFTRERKDLEGRLGECLRKAREAGLPKVEGAGEKYLVARSSDSAVLITSGEGVDARNFYAHAGFAGGALYTAAMLDGRVYACPLDSEKVLQLLKST